VEQWVNEICCAVETMGHSNDILMCLSQYIIQNVAKHNHLIIIETWKENREVFAVNQIQMSVHF
jgi:hypothetical protein